MTYNGYNYIYRTCNSPVVRHAPDRLQVLKISQKASSYLCLLGVFHA